MHVRCSPETSLGQRSKYVPKSYLLIPQVSDVARQMTPAAIRAPADVDDAGHTPQYHVCRLGMLLIAHTYTNA